MSETSKFTAIRTNDKFCNKSYCLSVHSYINVGVSFTSVYTDCEAQLCSCVVRICPGCIKRVLSYRTIFV